MKDSTELSLFDLFNVSNSIFRSMQFTILDILARSGERERERDVDIYFSKMYACLTKQKGTDSGFMESNNLNIPFNQTTLEPFFRTIFVMFSRFSQ
jgi:hypothetical protein